MYGLPSGSDGKESTSSSGDPGSSPGSERSLGEGNGYPLLYSCLENPMDRGTWDAAVMGLQRVEHVWVTKTHTYIYHTHILECQNSNINYLTLN